MGSKGSEGSVTHPYAGLVTMGRGLTRSVSNRTRRQLPSSLETSTVSRMESVQKSRRATWSTAMPSGLCSSEDTGREKLTHGPDRALAEGTLHGTFGDDRADVSSAQTGPADAWTRDVGPVNHLVHTVVGHSDQHPVLRRRAQTWVVTEPIRPDLTFPFPYLLGRAAAFGPPPSSSCIRPEARVRSSRSERTAGVSPEKRAGRRAAAPGPPEEESPPGRCLSGDDGWLPVDLVSDECGKRRLTQRNVSRARARVGNLPPGAVHAPALAQPAVALRGLVGAALVAPRHVGADGRPRAEGGRGLVSVTLTRALVSL